jgi:toxin ParE1/3/4
MEVKFTSSGRAHFLATIDSIRKENATAARRFRRAVQKALKRLERFPESGAVLAEFPDLPYREVYVKPYRFFYRQKDQTIWVVAVWHGARIPEDPVGGGRPHDD